MINKDSHSEHIADASCSLIRCGCKWNIHVCSANLVTRFNRKGQAYEICVDCSEAHDEAFPTGMYEEWWNQS